MNSSLYKGTIRHRRFTPVVNTFQYKVFFCFLDLSELDRVFAAHPLWSVNQVNAAYLRRRDHTGDPAISLDRSIRGAVADSGVARPEGPIRMLTHLRYFGYCFNPVTFYYCYDTAGIKVKTIVAEIHNTPWGEENLYVLDNSRNIHTLPDWRRFRFPKSFHVSPFMDMGIFYDWRFRVPAKELTVHMVSYENGERLFDASLGLTRLPITRRSLTRVLLHYPAMTAKVTVMIYWQALRLLLKGAPVFTHPRKRHKKSEGNRK